MKVNALHFCYWVLVYLSFSAVRSHGDDNKKCQWGVCDQKCVSTADDSYSCHCEIGWTLQDDGHSCKPENGEAFMIFATKKSIRGYRLDSMTNLSIAENLQHVVGVSLDSNYTYWSDIGERTISRSRHNGNEREAIITIGLDSPEDIAVDWITGNVYFTDATYKFIGVCNDNGDFCKVLVNDTERPRGIAVMPSTGKLYWTDWGDKAHIAKSNMDGTKKELFVTENMGWPNDLTIDYPSNRLYWVNAKQKKIECIGLDGTDRRLVLDNVAEHPYSIAVFGNRLYWSDWGTYSIHSCNKFTGKNFTTSVDVKEMPYGIHIYHSNLHVKQVNPCALKPCSQLCLLAENQTYTCACSMGTELDIDGRITCRDWAKEKHLAIAAGNAIVIHRDVVLGKPMSVTPNVTAYYINAVTCDPLKDTLIAIDVKAHSTFRYNLETKQVAQIESPIGNVVECIAFDYLGNNLYQSDGMFNTIKIHSLNTGEKTEFSYLESPYDIVLVPEDGMMFIVFRSNDSFHIDQAQMDGQGPRVRIVDQNLVGPKISLAYDKDTDRIYWSDEGASRIESANPYGQNRIVFRNGITSPVSIAILDNEIFWTLRRATSLNRAGKSSNTVIETLNFDIGQPVDIPLLQTIDGFYVRGLHPCSINNGNCSHVCLVTDAKNRLCACPTNVDLDSDMKTCKTKTSHPDEINNSCSSGHFWIGLFVGVLAFVTVSVMHYYFKTLNPNFVNRMNLRTPNKTISFSSNNRYRNTFNSILTNRRRNNLASISTSTIESY